MGTSIHMHLEVKKGDTWYHYASPSIYRDPIFFSLLANVWEDRDDFPKPLIPRRGLPENLSFVTLHDYQQDCESYSIHHESWMSAEELKQLQERLNRHYEFSEKRFHEYNLEDHYFHTFINGNAVAQHQGWDDLRFIFWFDN